MAQRNSARIDRFAQMSKQEEIIAKKRQEILEKQRTTELAKAVAAAQTLAAKLKGVNDEPATTIPVTEPQTVEELEELKQEEVEDDKKVDSAEAGSSAAATKSLSSLTSKTGKMYGSGVKRAPVAAPSIEQPPSKIQNNFCNDGSFLENFKKILEKQQQQIKPIVTIPEEAPSTNDEEIPSAMNTTETSPTEQTSTLPTVTESMIVTNPQQQQQLQQQHQQQELHHQQHQLQQHQQHQLQQHHQHQLQQQQHQQQHHLPLQHHQHSSLPPPPPNPPSLGFQFNSALMAAQNLMLQQTMQDPNSTQAPTMPPHTAAAAYFTTAPHFVPPPPPPTTVAAAAAAAAGMLLPMQGVGVAPPPPPPPPQLPLALANLTPLYMIPAPEPLQLNAIPQPKEFDLNAIPKPQLNLEAIQIPVQHLQQQQQQHEQQQHEQQQQQINMQQEQQHQQQQQMQQQQQQTLQPQQNQYQQQPQQFEQFEHESEAQFQQQKNTPPQQQQSQQQQDDYQQNNEDQNPVDNNCIQIPTSIENLIDLVADNGDAYEETLRGLKNQLHPALWFLSDKDSEQYHHYRQEIIDRRQEKLKEQQQKEKDEQEQEKKANPTGYKQKRLYCSIEEDKYDPESVISADNDSDDEYRRGMMDRNRDNIKRRIECRNELSEEERQEREAEEQEELRRMEKKKLRKSRWGGKIEMPESSSSSSMPCSFANQNKPILSTVTRTDPALLSYAKLNYGSTNLTDEDWKKCEEHFKVNLLYQDMIRKRQEIDRLAKSGKFKYEYDSDEDVDGGTWEHKLRLAEMEATTIWAQALTKQSEGKHHIGDFLPPEELKKFMEQYEAKKNNRLPDLSDYKEYKLKEDNIGFQMLQKLGWKEGQGLGQDGAGIVDPVNKGPQREGNQGLGVSNSATPEECDNEYDAYRKRMMLAYRFRPNPLNNPRRAYY